MHMCLHPQGVCVCTHMCLHPQGVCVCTHMCLHPQGIPKRYNKEWWERKEHPCSCTSTWKMRANVETGDRLLTIWEQSLVQPYGWWPWCLLGRAKAVCFYMLVRKTDMATGCSGKFLPINTLLGEKENGQRSHIFNRKLLELDLVHEIGEW